MSDSEVVKQMRPLVLHCKSIIGEKLDVFVSKPTEAGPWMDGWNSSRFGWGLADVHIRWISWEYFLSENTRKVGPY